MLLPPQKAPLQSALGGETDDLDSQKKQGITKVLEKKHIVFMVYIYIYT